LVSCGEVVDCQFSNARYIYHRIVDYRIVSRMKPKLIKQQHKRSQVIISDSLLRCKHIFV